MLGLENLLSTRRVFVFGTLISAAAFSGIQLASIDTSIIYGDSAVSAVPPPGCTLPWNDTALNKTKSDVVIPDNPLSAIDIVHRSFNSSFTHLTSTCTDKETLLLCCKKTFRYQNTPWWFQTMMRDARANQPWHTQSAHKVTSSGEALQMCSMQKIGTKHWKRLFCHLQNRKFHRQPCFAKPRVPQNAPKFVFLRDPLERFLSAFLDKCESRRRIEGHCEPTIVFTEDNSSLNAVLKDNKKVLFEAYVDVMPLKWNIHFLPQR